MTNIPAQRGKEGTAMTDEEQISRENCDLCHGTRMIGRFDQMRGYFCDQPCPICGDVDDPTVDDGLRMKFRSMLRGEQ